MKPRIGAALLGLAVLGACSVLNAPEELQTEGSGASNMGATGNVGGNGNTAGSKSGGGDGTAGSMTGMAGCGSECPEGGAPPIGKACESSADDCGSTAPICDKADFECRPCGADPECNTELQLPYCLQTGDNAGRCAECRTHADCPSTAPVCNAIGVCRGCTEHTQCESGACDELTGVCAPEGEVVYALALTGSTDTMCGTLNEPCRFIGTAVGKLSAQRPNLVLLETTTAFEPASATLPAIKGLKVIGNGNVVPSAGGATVFQVPAGAAVTFENVVIEGATTEEEGGIECTGGTITVVGSELRDNGTGVYATDCHVTVTDSLIEHNANPLQFGGAGIRSRCTATCARTLHLARNRFIDNGVATYISQVQEATIENNLFLRNGSPQYTRVIELRAEHTRFAYNTLVENFNGCTFVGIVACDQGVCDNIGNISYRSFPAETEPCYDQVWYNGTVSYSLTEITQPGMGNKTGDPLFVDAASGDYTPGPGSPALDSGPPNDPDAPTVDIDGNPRPSGSAPDMGAFEAQ